MRKTQWRSLHTHIVLLAIITCVFLLLAVGGLVLFIRSSHTATVAAAEKHLAQVAAELARTYSSQAAHGLSLQNVTPPSKPDRPPPPPPPPRELPDGKKGPRGPRERPKDPLAELTASVLQSEDNIEGGFLAGHGPLVGYAFPTHEGPGEQQEMPARERPIIDRLSHEAETSSAAQTYRFEGPHDVVLFHAEPVREQVDGKLQVTGAAWLMQRLPDANRGRSQQLIFASVGFAMAALITGLLAWLVTSEVNGGVDVITRRLASLEQDLNRVATHEERPQLAEFDLVLAGIDDLASALQHRMANERSLEDQLRHKERLSSLGQFAAGVAHELRNPLATIRLRAQMSQHASSDSAVNRNGIVILEEVDRLDRMIGRLLYFARPISLDLQPVDLAELCRTAVDSWKDRVPAGVHIATNVEKGIEVFADRSRLIQVLDNLVENACHASQSTPGEVLIRALKEGETVHIEVLDRGSGFSAETLKHAFDPFFTTKDSGTGLGLSIAFELVEAHGGKLTAASRSEGGAVVSITLPLVSAAQDVCTR